MALEVLVTSGALTMINKTQMCMLNEIPDGTCTQAVQVAVFLSVCLAMLFFASFFSSCHSSPYFTNMQ